MGGHIIIHQENVLTAYHVSSIISNACYYYIQTSLDLDISHVVAI